MEQKNKYAWTEFKKEMEILLFKAKVNNIDAVVAYKEKQTDRVNQPKYYTNASKEVTEDILTNAKGFETRP